MRILYHHRTLADGAEGIHIREMVKAFRDLGHEVKVVGPVGEARSGSSRKLGILATIKRSIPTVVFELCEIAYTAYGFISISRKILKFKPDFIYDRYITFNAGVVLAGMAHSVPVCLEVNAPLALERSRERDERLVLKRIAFRIERWVCANADQTVVVSTPLKEYLESVGVPLGKCIVMPNGVDPVRFTPRIKNPSILVELGIPDDRFVIGFTGVIRQWHGLDSLVIAVGNLLKKGRKVFLLIVGHGPHQEALEIMVSELGLEGCIKITGQISHDRIPEYVALFDIAVSPKATFYASPMKVIEYMALGKPVAVPSTANFLDIVDVGVNGITFEDENPVELERAIDSLCQLPQLCRDLGLHGREKVEKRLNWQWNAEEVCSLFATQLHVNVSG